MSSQQHRAELDHPCRLCGAPAGMTCLEYKAMKQMNAAFDRIEGAFTTPEELRADSLVEGATI